MMNKPFPQQPSKNEKYFKMKFTLHSATIISKPNTLTTSFQIITSNRMSKHLFLGPYEACI